MIQQVIKMPTTKKIIALKEFTKHLSNPDRILAVLQGFDIPVPLNIIAWLAGLRKDHCCQILSRLMARREVRKVTTVTCSFYTLEKGNSNEKNDQNAN